MNIFVAGVHGVGKTYLAQQLPVEFGLVHTSASKLIKEERSMATWGTDKKVSDVDGNQLALAAAVSRHNKAGVRLLLDGHFVLRDASGQFVRLGADVFGALNLNAVILLEAAPHLIAERVLERDAREESIEELRLFLDAERAQAMLVCEVLGIGLTVASSPTAADFAEMVSCAQRQ
jgi:adenylate kinase